MRDGTIRPTFPSSENFFKFASREFLREADQSRDDMTVRSTDPKMSYPADFSRLTSSTFVAPPGVYGIRPHALSLRDHRAAVDGRDRIAFRVGSGADFARTPGRLRTGPRDGSPRNDVQPTAHQFADSGHGRFRGNSLCRLSDRNGSLYCLWRRDADHGCGTDALGSSLVPAPAHSTPVHTDCRPSLWLVRLSRNAWFVVRPPLCPDRWMFELRQ